MPGTPRTRSHSEQLPMVLPRLTAAQSQKELSAVFDVAMAPHAASAKPPLYTKMEGYRCSMCQLDEAMYAPVKHGYGSIRGGKATATGEPQQGQARTATPTKVIVLVLPYRGREQNLDTFLRWMLRYAKDRAGERWLVYKVEQNNTLPFNKGWCALYAPLLVRNGKDVSHVRARARACKRCCFRFVG